jgi:hypothetical protein
LKYAIATANRYIELKPLARILESTRPNEEWLGKYDRHE